MQSAKDPLCQQQTIIATIASFVLILEVDKIYLSLILIGLVVTGSSFLLVENDKTFRTY